MSIGRVVTKPNELAEYDQKIAQNSRKASVYDRRILELQREHARLYKSIDFLRRRKEQQGLK
jgi:hypothetical protein